MGTLHQFIMVLELIDSLSTLAIELILEGVEVVAFASPVGVLDGGPLVLLS